MGRCTLGSFGECLFNHNGTHLVTYWVRSNGRCTNLRFCNKTTLALQIADRDFLVKVYLTFDLDNFLFTGSFSFLTWRLLKDINIGNTRWSCMEQQHRCHFTMLFHNGK